MNRFYIRLLARPRTCLALILVITLALAVPAARIRIDSSVEGLTVEGAPERAYFDEVREVFGNDEILLVAVVTPDTVFRSDTLGKVRRISDAMQAMDGVERVASLSTVYNITPTDEGIQIRLLMEEVPRTGGEMQSLVEAVRSNPIYGKSIVSEDLRTAAVNVFVENRPGEEAFREAIVRRLMEIVREEEGPEAIHVAGIPYSKVMMNRYQQGDLMKFTPLTLLVVAAILILSFGSFRGVVIPLLTVGAATVWTLGVMSLLGKSISVISTTIPSLILAIGSAYSIHVISHYYESVTRGRSGREALAQAFAYISLPVTVTAVTTLAAFLSIAVNRIPAVRDFGLFGLVGIFSSLVLSLTLAPGCLAVLKTRPPGKWGMEGSGGSGRRLERIADFNRRNRKRIILVSLLLFALGLAGIRFIRVDTAYMSYLRPGDPVIRDLHEIEQRLAGSVLWNVVVEGDEEGVLKDPETARALSRLQAFIEARPWVDKTTSYLDYLRLIAGALGMAGADGSGLPETEEGISQCLLLYSFSDPETLDQLVTGDFTRANLVVRAPNMGSRAMEAAILEIEAEAAGVLPPGLTVKMTGTGFLMLKSADQVAAGQIQSVLIALAIIFCILWALFLSLKVSLVSMIPNMVPIGILFGIMGWMGITLNTATSLVASIALAIAVDDTIHYLTRFTRELKNTYSEEAAMKAALVSSGRPIIYTTAALCLGFLVLCFSSFMPIFYFGLLMAVTLFICVLADLLFLPSVLVSTRIVTLWDLFLLKMGKDPHRTIPLFRGMRPAHARLLVLMGMLRPFRAGETILRKGEKGDEMFLVLRGAVEVFDPAGGTPRALAVHRRGEVFGEMGLVRDTVRSASARALEEAELFAVNRDALTRMQRRYPRLSSRFFLNLSVILSDRLQHRTEQYLGSRV